MSADMRDVWAAPLDPLRFVVALKKYAGTSGPDDHDLRSTKVYEVPPEVAVLDTDALHEALAEGRDLPAVKVGRTKRGLRFTRAGMAPLDDVVDHVAWCLDVYARAVAEANRPEGRLYG